MSTLRIAVIGARGGIGAAVCEAIGQADDLVLAARVVRQPEGGEFATLGEALRTTPIDVAFEATRPDTAERHIRTAVDAGVPVVVATTAWDKPAVDAYARDHDVAVFYAPNYAIAAVVLFGLAQQAARVLADCAIVECHPPTKIDAPSGTALTIANLIAAVTGERPPISSLRVAGVISSHEVLFGAAGQTLTLCHEVTSNACFTDGVLLALRQVRGLPAGLTIGMDAIR